MHDAPITDTIGKSMGKAMPDLRGTDVANVPHELVMACGMSPEFDEHVEQNHTMQLIGQDKWSTTNQDPNPARRTGHHTELESHLTKSYSYMDQFPLHPEPHIGDTIFGAPHDSYPVQTFKTPEDAANHGARRYSFPPPTHTQAPPHYNKPRAPLALEYTSFHANKPNQPLHREPWTGLNSRGRTRITNVDTRQRCLRPIDVTDKNIDNHRIVDQKNEHRKRKTAATEKPNML